MPEEILETPQPTQPVEQKSPDWTKVILVTVFGFGLLAASAYAGYWYGAESSKIKSQNSKPQLKNQISETPTLSPTDWSTYTNPDHNYSLKHRSDFVIEKEGSKTIIRSAVAAKGGGIADEGWFDLVIDVIDNPEGQSAREYVKTYAESLKFKNPNWDINEISQKFHLTREKNIIESFVDYKNGQVDGIKGDIDGFENPNITIIETRGNKVYSLRLRGGPNTGTLVTETAKEMFDQILSTFKFLD